MTETEAQPCTADAVRAQLNRVLGSAEFRASERSRSFLRFVVEETLAGRGPRLKAFTIAVEAFGRDAGFDTRNDPAVRLEAGRLRRALEHYYLTDGRDAPVEIVIPKGSYQPTFIARVPATPPARPAIAVAPADGRRRAAMLAALVLLLVGGLAGWWWLRMSRPAERDLFRPSVLVVPFEARGSGAASLELAFGITAQVVAELTRFRELTVHGRTWPAGTPLADPMSSARELDVSHVLEGNVAVAGERVRIRVQLSSAEEGTSVWAASYDRDLRAADLFAVQDEVATEVAMRIAQPFGDIARTPPRADGRPDDLEAYRCGMAFYAYRRNFDRDEHLEVQACLEATVERHPDYATAWAMLAMVRADSDRFGFPAPPGTRSPLALAAEAARRALAIDPTDARAWQALMLASYLSGDVAEGQAAGERALALNPNDLELVGEFGNRLAMAGKWARGTAMIAAVVDRDPAGSRFHLTVLAVDAIRTGRHEEALALLDRAQSVSLPTTDLLRAAALGHLGRIDEARTAGESGMRGLPGVMDRLDAEFAKRNFQADVRQALLDGWRKAGLPVPDAPGPSARSNASPPG